MTFTKGPWRVDPDCPADVQTSDGSMEIGSCYDTDIVGQMCRIIGPAPSREEKRANARLIAAAPELYEALKNIVREHREGPATDAARAALTKADGWEVSAKLVDPRVHDLAETWLEDESTRHLAGHSARVMRLAQHIQQAVEDWCDDDEDREEDDE